MRKKLDIAQKRTPSCLLKDVYLLSILGKNRKRDGSQEGRVGPKIPQEGEVHTTIIPPDEGGVGPKAPEKNGGGSKGRI